MYIINQIQNFIHKILKKIISTLRNNKYNSQALISKKQLII
jgi:hypothetical protein